MFVTSSMWLPQRLFNVPTILLRHVRRPHKYCGAQFLYQSSALMENTFQSIVNVGLPRNNTVSASAQYS